MMANLAGAVKAAEVDVPKKRAQLEAAKAKVDTEVENLVAAVANGGGGVNAIVNRLAELEAEQKALGRRFEELAAETTEDDLPTEADVLQEFEAFLEVLPHGDPALLLLLRQSIGRIEADQVVAPGKKRGYAVLRITLDLSGIVTGLLKRRLPPTISLVMSKVSSEPIKLTIPLGEPTGPDQHAPQIYAWRTQTPPMPWSEISRRTKLTIATCQIAFKRYAAAVGGSDSNPADAA